MHAARMWFAAIASLDYSTAGATAANLAIGLMRRLPVCSSTTNAAARVLPMASSSAPIRHGGHLEKLLEPDRVVQLRHAADAPLAFAGRDVDPVQHAVNVAICIARRGIKPRFNLAFQQLEAGGGRRVHENLARQFAVFVDHGALRFIRCERYVFGGRGRGRWFRRRFARLAFGERFGERGALIVQVDAGVPVRWRLGSRNGRGTVLPVLPPRLRARRARRLRTCAGGRGRV